MTPEDVRQLKLPRDLPQIRTGLAAMLDNGQDPSPILAALAARNALALADVVVGPKGLQGPSMARAALRFIDALESVVSPSALYRRLIQLAGEARGEVLSTAARRHPSERWVLPLSVLAEGAQAGLTHITHAPPALLPTLCAAYAEAGATGGLIAACRVLRDDEPALALLRAGELGSAARATGVLLSVHPHVPVVERMAAIWGPDISSMLAALIAAAPHQDVLTRLGDYTHEFPELDAARKARLASMA